MGETFENTDPRQIGTEGLKGINTNSGRSRLLEQLGIPQTREEYNDFSRSQGTNYEAPIQVEDFGRYTNLLTSNVDKKINNPSDLETLYDTRGRLQSKFEQVSNGATKGIVLAGTTIGNTLGTFTAGLVSAITNNDFSKLYDNEVSRTMDKLNKLSEEYLPNFYTQDEMDHSLAFRNLFSSNTLGDKFMKNLGFTVGSMYVGMGAGAVSRAIGLTKAFSGLVSSTGATKAISSLVGSMLASVGESAFEAKNAQNEFLEGLERQHEENLMKIQYIYGDTPDAYQLMNEENLRYNQEKQSSQEYADKIGDLDFIFNVAILSASNYIQFGKAFARGFKTAEREAATRAGKMVSGEIGKFVANGSTFKNLLNIAGRSATEGTEEIAQQLATDISTNIYKNKLFALEEAKFDPEAIQLTVDNTKIIGDTFLSTMGRADTWEQFIIGSLTGVTGAPVFTIGRNAKGKIRPKFSMQGNAINEFREYKQAQAEAEQMASKLNEYGSRRDIVTRWRANIANAKLQADMDKAAEEGDRLSYNDAQFLSHANMVDMYVRMDRLAELKNIINDVYDTSSDENLQAILDATSRTVSNPDGTTTVEQGFNRDGKSIDIRNQEDKEWLVQQIKDKKEEIDKVIKSFEENSKRLSNQPGQSFNEEQRAILTWGYSMLDNWIDRGKSIAKDQVMPVLNTIRDAMIQTRTELSDRLEEGGNTQEEIDRYDGIIKKIDTSLDNIDKITRDGNEALLKRFMTSKFDGKSNIIEVANNIINNYADLSGVDIDEKQSALSAIQDLEKLANNYKNVNKELIIYLNNPSKLQKAINKTANNISTKINKHRGKKIKSELANAVSLREFRNIIKNSTDSPDVVKQAIDDLTSESHTLASEYTKLNKAKDAIDAYLVGQNLSVDDYSDVNDLINHAFNASENEAQFLDMSAQAYLEDEYLESKEADPVKRNARHMKARVFATNAIDDYKTKAGIVSNLASSTNTNNTGSTNTSSTPQSSRQAQSQTTPSKSQQTTSTRGSTQQSSSSDNNPAVEPVKDDLSAQDVFGEVSGEMPDRQSPEEKQVNYLQALSSKHNYSIKLFKKNSDGTISLNTDFYKSNPSFNDLLAYLEEGFKYVDEGKLNVGDEVTIGMHEINGTKYLIAYIKVNNNWLPLNNISGYATDEVLDKNVGLKELYHTILDEYNKEMEDESKKGQPYISKYTTKVNDILIGRPTITDKLTPLATVIENTKSEDIKFAIMRDGTLHFGVDEGTKVGGSKVSINDQTLHPINPNKNNGRLYITFPNARRSGYNGRNTLPIIIKKLSKDVLNNSPELKNRINDALANMHKAFIENNRNEFVAALNELRKYLNLNKFDVILDTNKRQIHFNKFKLDSEKKKIFENGKPTYDSGALWIGNTNITFDDFVDVIFKKFIKEGIRFNVDLSQLNKADYTKFLLESDILDIYAGDLDSIGGWFTLDPIVNGKSVKGDKIKPITTPEESATNNSSTSNNPATTQSVPKAPGTNIVTPDAVNVRTKTFNYRGIQYTYDRGIIYKPNGQRVSITEMNIHLSRFAGAVTGKYPTFNNGRYVFVSEGDYNYILDMQTGDYLTNNDKAYHEIYDIALNNTASAGLRQEDLFIMNQLKNARHQAFTLTYVVDGQLRTNVAYLLGESDGHTVFMSFESEYDGSNNIVPNKLQPIIIVENKSRVNGKIERKAFKTNPLDRTKQGGFSTDFLKSLLGIKFNDPSTNVGGQVKTIVDEFNTKNTNQQTQQKAPIQDIDGSVNDNTDDSEDIFLLGGDDSLSSKPASEVNNDDDDYINALAEESGDDDNLYRIANKEEIRVFDKKTETDWLEKNLPNLSNDQRIKFVEGLIPVMQSGRKAWGMFDGAMMTISNVAAPGTVYHEAFHAVFHMLLNEDERSKILNDARNKYGKDKTQLELEEILADEFINYVENSKSIIGRIKNFFSGLKIKKDFWNSHRLAMYSLFNDINNGKYANLKPNSVKLDTPRDGDSKNIITYKDLIDEAEMQELINDGHHREFIEEANDDLLEIIKTCAGIA